jgi:NADPH:quinone reductase-like Zn-dependent oxidoreductase
MKAIYIDGHGGNEVVKVGERHTPQRQTGEVLLRMQASTLNQVDLYMRNSGAGITHQLPQTMGIEGFGHVAECDADSGFNVGDAVVIHPSISCGHCEFCQRGVMCCAHAFPSSVNTETALGQTTSRCLRATFFVRLAT